MPFGSNLWGQFSATDYETPENSCAACLIDLNEPGGEKIKANCKLPVKEPGGTYNVNGIHAAAAALAAFQYPTPGSSR